MSESNIVRKRPIDRADDADYLAFISYSHKDNEKAGKRWADWLQKTIAGFEIPADFVGAEGRNGLVPEKMGEVFLDRLNLVAAGKLNPKLEEALKGTRFLIVLCSTESVNSEYVALEIERFHAVHGSERILPVLIDGEDHRHNGHCAVSDSLFRVFGGKLPLYVDFRAKEGEVKVPGWTDPARFARHLRKTGTYRKRARREMVRIYRRDHQDATFKLLGALLGVEPVKLKSESLAEENVKQRWHHARLVAVAVVMTMLAAIALAYEFKATSALRVAERERQRAEGERLRAERSSMMIGDAHEDATDLAGDLLTLLRRTGNAATENQIPSELTTAEVLQGVVGKAEEIVGVFHSDSAIGGDDEQSRHMRSVVLNNQGRMAVKLGDFAQAAELFELALKIRRQLAEEHPGRALYLHNLAVSCDNIGDLHVVLAKKSKNRNLELKTALDYYRAGLKWSRELTSLPDADAFWRHDLAVSYFKIASAEYQRDEREAGLEWYLDGLVEAKSLAASDPDYAKWQALLAFYYLQIGTVYDDRAESEKSLEYLREGKLIFDRLAGRKQLSSQDSDNRAALENLLKKIERSLAFVP